MLISSSFLLLLFTAIPASSEPIGTLEIDVRFSNPRAKLPSGSHCDSFIWNYKCDIFFIICVAEASSTRECNLHFARTHPVLDTETLSKLFAVDYMSDQTVNLTITVMDHDSLSGPDYIAGYAYSFLPSALADLQEIHPTSQGNAHSSIEMHVQVRRKCKPHFYGSKCIRCDVPEDRGSCDPDGFHICQQGFFGPGCSQHDLCATLSPCAPFAVCENTENSFRCLCDGTSGKRCEVGFNPCEGHNCLHNGTCTAVGANRNFAECVNCDIGWGGLHCEEEADACVQEERRLGRPPCGNGGHCVNRMNGTAFTCFCEDGWQGPRCETSFVMSSAIVVVIVVCLLAVLTGCIFALVCCFRVCLLPKLRLIIQKQRGVEMQPMKGDLNSGMWRANNLYEEMGTQSAAVAIKARGILDDGPPPSKIADDADYEEYETMDFEKYGPTHTRFTPASAPESVDEGEYEPVSIRVGLRDRDLATQTPNSGSVCINDEGYEELTARAADRPLPAPPAILEIDKDSYKQTVNSQPMC